MQENFESWGRLDEFMGYFLYDPSNRTTQIWPFWYLSIFTLLALTFYTAYRYREKKAYQRFFQSLQAVQLILLYGWYWINHMPLSESLPFYHCRMAMFVVLLLPGQSKYRQYFALLGNIWDISSLCLSSARCLSFPTYCDFILYLLAT